MTRTLGRILLSALVAGGATIGSAFIGGAASAADCPEPGLRLSCPVLVPPPTTEPEPDPSPEPPAEPAPAPSEPDPAPAPPATDTEDGAVRRLLVLIEGDRRTHGVAELEARQVLADVAAVHSRAMADREDLWHNDELFTASTKARLGVRLVAENVASNRSIDDAHRRLMASASHRANLLSGTYEQVGVGVARAGDTWFITEVFASPVGGAVPAAAAASAPRPSAPPRAARPAPTAVGTPGPPPSAPAAVEPELATAVTPGEVPLAPSTGAPESVPSGSRAIGPAATPAAPLLAGALLVGVVGAIARRGGSHPVSLVLLVTGVSERMSAWMTRLRRPAAVPALRHPRFGAR